MIRSSIGQCTNMVNFEICISVAPHERWRIFAALTIPSRPTEGILCNDRTSRPLPIFSSSFRRCHVGEEISLLPQVEDSHRSFDDIDYFVVMRPPANRAWLFNSHYLDFRCISHFSHDRRWSSSEIRRSLFRTVAPMLLSDSHIRSETSPRVANEFDRHTIDVLQVGLAR